MLLLTTYTIVLLSDKLQYFEEHKFERMLSTCSNYGIVDLIQVDYVIISKITN